MIDFQPTPKRFMVWSVDLKKFLASKEAHKCMWHDFVKTEPFGKCELQSTAKHIVCQSTNLFDKDGKEIFEGSIVRVGGETGIIQMVLGEWHAVGDDDIPLSVWKPSGIEMLGHILSNPELVEEK